ncbi:MAG: excisionase family DNA-binding protein [Proteobacteria bacterium]|nr:excisionase family DNA-binding protein [Pseudomonadota bacterium]
MTNLPVQELAPASRGEDPLALSISLAAKRAGISRSLLYQELKAGRLASAKFGKRRLIPFDALREWLAKATGRAI